MADIANIDNMAAKLAQALTEYDQGVADAMKEVIDEQSDETVDALKSKSPKRSGAYAKGWRKSRYTKQELKNRTPYIMRKSTSLHTCWKRAQKKEYRQSRSYAYVTNTNYSTKSAHSTSGAAND